MSQPSEDVRPLDFEPAPNGRVTVPTQMRRTIGWHHPMVMYIEDGRVIIEPRAQLAARTKRDVAMAWQCDDDAVDELIRDRRADAVREHSE